MVTKNLQLLKGTVLVLEVLQFSWKQVLQYVGNNGFYAVMVEMTMMLKRPITMALETSNKDEFL